MNAVLAYLAPRTIEEGDCLLWQLATNSAGAPVASIEGQRSRPVRRWVWAKTHGRDAGPLRLLPTCGHSLCVAPGHQKAVTPAAVNVAIGARGGFSTPAFKRARRRAGRSQSDLTLADVRVIRHRRLVNGEILRTIADDYPVSISTLSRICRGEDWPDPEGNVFSGLMR